MSTLPHCLNSYPPPPAPVIRLALGSMCCPGPHPAVPGSGSSCGLAGPVLSSWPLSAPSHSLHCYSFPFYQAMPTQLRLLAPCWERHLLWWAWRGFGHAGSAEAACLLLCAAVAACGCGCLPALLLPGSLPALLPSTPSPGVARSALGWLLLLSPWMVAAAQPIAFA